MGFNQSCWFSSEGTHPSGPGPAAVREALVPLLQWLGSPVQCTCVYSCYMYHLFPEQTSPIPDSTGILNTRELAPATCSEPDVTDKRTFLLFFHGLKVEGGKIPPENELWPVWRGGYRTSREPSTGKLLSRSRSKKSTDLSPLQAPPTSLTSAEEL